MSCTLLQNAGAKIRNYFDLEQELRLFFVEKQKKMNLGNAGKSPFYHRFHTKIKSQI